MRYLLSGLILIGLNATAQKIEKVETDEFNGATKKQSSWHTVTGMMDGTQAGVSFRTFNNKAFLELKIYTHNIIGENDKLMLKLDNDSIITLFAAKTSVPCRGCASWNIIGADAIGNQNTYEMRPEAMALLSVNKVKLMRVNYQGNVYADIKVSDKGKDAMQKLANLFR